MSVKHISQVPTLPYSFLISMDSSQHHSETGSTSSKAEAERQLDEKYPNRPKNSKPTLPFHILFEELFNPLNENRKQSSNNATKQRLSRFAGGPKLSAHEKRRSIIQSFITRWRHEVGDDIYPAFRLIMPEKDRERAMYGK